MKGLKLILTTYLIEIIGIFLGIILINFDNPIMGWALSLLCGAHLLILLGAGKLYQLPEGFMLMIGMGMLFLPFIVSGFMIEILNFSFIIGTGCAIGTGVIILFGLKHFFKNLVKKSKSSG